MSGGRRLWAIGFASLLAASSKLHAQSSFPVQYLPKDRPEAWAMNYEGTSTLLTAFGQVPHLAPGSWTIAGELGDIPRLSDAQRRVGFDGVKLEDLNKSPVFGRARGSVGLPFGWIAELGYTPPISVDGSRTDNLFALGIGRLLLESQAWTLSGRVFGQHGSARGDITCPAALANVTDLNRNPYGCQAASHDREGLNYYAGDLVIGYSRGPTHLHADFGWVRAQFDVQVDALTFGFNDRSRLNAHSNLPYYAFGLRQDLGTHWSSAAEVLYVPLSVRRPPDFMRESDPLTSVRLQLQYRAD